MANPRSPMGCGVSRWWRAGRAHGGAARDGRHAGDHCARAEHLAGTGGGHPGPAGAARSRREPDAPTPREREIARAWQRKTTVPGFAVSGLVLIRAGKMGRARELAAHIENVLRARRGIAGGVRITYGRSHRSLAALPKTTRTSGWLSNAELLPLLAWPLGADVAVAGVELGGRELAPAAHLATSGRRLFVGRDLGGERWVALEPQAARLHTAVVGSSGSGKIEMLARGILDEIAAGHAGVVLPDGVGAGSGLAAATAYWPESTAIRRTCAISKRAGRLTRLWQRGILIRYARRSRWVRRALWASQNGTQR